MRVKEMHPLCCISLESPGGSLRDQSPEPPLSASLLRARSLPATATAGGSDGNAGRSEATVAGVLHKWTNYGKGWRSRWFLLRNGVLSYTKIRRTENLNLLMYPTSDDVTLIGEIPANRLSRLDSSGRRKHHQKTVGIVHLKISSFRESKSDDRKFYIFTATKTLHLRTDSKSDRVAWIQALVSTRSLFLLRPINDNLSLVPNDISISTERLKKRLLDEGINENLVNDCEQIMRSEFSEIEGQVQVLCQQRSILLDTLRQLEAANIEAEASGIHDGEYQLTKHEFSGLGRGKYSECSTTESSDDIEKQELEEVSDEDEMSFHDSKEYFTEPNVSCGSIKEVSNHLDNYREAESQCDVVKVQNKREVRNSRYPHIERRKKLPDPVEKEKGVSLWSMIKDNVGKDLTRVCLPVYFNEPISSLQKCCEDLEYSFLLDQAYEYGKAGNSLQRILNVAAFAVSGYASSEGRHCKPFNPLLGETYEADYPEKGIRFFSEKVSHHPTLIACHCEGRGWKFWCDSNIRTKFWGRSIQLDPVGVLTLEFDDGEIFQWSKVTTTIYNLILGKVYCDHHGTMHIHGLITHEEYVMLLYGHVSHHPTLIACHCEGRGWKFWCDSNIRTKFWGRSIQLDPVGVLTLEFDDGEIFQWSKVTTTIYNLILGKVYCDHHGTMHIHGNREYSCKLKFKEQSILDRNPRQVNGFVEDVMGKKVATLFGKWDDSMYYVNNDGSGKPKDCTSSSDASLLWKRSKPPPNLTRYNLTSFAITLNELTPGLQLSDPGYLITD
nr:oxysterol-binding protein-related protein 2a [Quercus suber]